MGQKHSHGRVRPRTPREIKSFPDLALLPPEVAVEVLSHLDATDLCLAACVNELWWSLANVELLWKRSVHCMPNRSYVFSSRETCILFVCISGSTVVLPM